MLACFASPNLTACTPMLIACTPHCTPQVQGLAQVDHSPSVLLLDAVCDRVLELGDNVGRDRRDEIMNGLERLGHSCKTHQPNPPKPRNDRSGRGEAEM